MHNNNNNTNLNKFKKTQKIGSNHKFLNMCNNNNTNLNKFLKTKW